MLYLNSINISFKTGKLNIINKFLKYFNLVNKYNIINKLHF